MPNKIIALLLAAATIVSQLSSTHAQVATPLDEWATIKSVPPGDKLVVRLKDGSKITGRLRGVSDTRLTLARNNGSTDLERQEIRKIERVIPKSAARPTLIGAGTGAAIAVGGIGIAAAADDTGGSKGELAAATLGFALIGAGVGALVGLAIGSREKKVLIYESR